MKHLFKLLFIILFFVSNKSVLSQEIPQTTQNNSGQIQVTGSVPTNVNDYHISIAPNKSTDINIYDEITYIINYGSFAKKSIPLKITMEWSRGTLADSPAPSVDIIDYVIGSASNAYNDSPPIIDINNRRITWVINSYPANLENQKVFFKLRLNDSYIGPSRVYFDVKSKLSLTSIELPSNTVNAYLNPYSSIIPTPVLATNNQIKAPTVTPKYSQGSEFIPLSISKIDTSNILKDSVQITVFTTKEAENIKIIYGSSLDNLDKSINQTNNKVRSTLKIDSLTKATDYYFKVIASNSKETFSTDIYTFKTSSDDFLPQIDQSSLIISVNNNILLDSKSDNDPTNSVVVVPSQKYGVRLSIKDSDYIKLVQLKIQNSQVLGISTQKVELSQSGSDLTEIYKGTYLTSLMTPRDPGYYDIIARIEDIKGNVHEEKIGNLKIIDPLTIINSRGKPIENAKITLYMFELQTKRYVPIPPEYFAIKNPDFTNYKGQLNVVLPKGKYKAEISAIGFKDTSISFTIGVGEDENLPAIRLDRINLGFSLIIIYYQQIIADIFYFFIEILGILALSTRVFSLFNTVLFIITFINLWYFLSLYYKVHWRVLPFKVKLFIKNIFTKNIKGQYYGQVINKSNRKSLSDLILSLIDSNTNNILETTITNSKGEFYFSINPKDKNIKINIDNKNNLDIISQETNTGIKKDDLIISLLLAEIQKNNKSLLSFSDLLLKIFYTIFLISIFILEIMFTGTLGWSKVWFNVLLTCFNITIWFFIILNLYEKKKNK